MKKFFILLISIALFLIFILFFYLRYSGLETENILFIHRSADAKGENVLILRVNPMAEREFELFLLPAKSQVELLGSYGSYELRSVYPLLKLDKRDDSFINASFSSALQILVGRSIALEEIPNTQNLQSLKELLIRICFDRNADLSLRERLLLLKIFFRIDDLSFELSKLDSIVELDLDEDSASCSVAVVNTTAKNGLGKSMANLMERNGFRVVKVSDTEDKMLQSNIVLARDEGNCKQLTKLLYKALPANDAVSLEETLFSQYRADIVIFLGTDLIE